MAGLPRELLKWLQSLDLTWQVKMPKWDLTNGFLIAEIFSWYYPHQIHMHSYNNGTSLISKVKNWSLLKVFIRLHQMEIPDDFIEGTIHTKEGAAQLLIERIYELLTNRPVKKFPSPPDLEFTDSGYQILLPPHARSTASQAIKNNIRITELLANTNLVLNQQKCQHIIDNHILHRVQERYDHPDRFDIRPTLGELCPRSEPNHMESLSLESTMIGSSPRKSPAKSFTRNVRTEENRRATTKAASPGATVYYREIEVNQSQPPNSLQRPIGSNC